MRKENLKFHIKSQDYFGTLATVLDLLRQTKKDGEIVLKKITDELLYLQSNYKIVKKDEK